MIVFGFNISDYKDNFQNMICIGQWSLVITTVSNSRTMTNDQ
jgi:hypothetical protein